MSPLPKERDEDIGVLGFQDIKKIHGLLVDIAEENQPEAWEGEGKVAKVYMEDTVVLETFSGDDSFELTDKKFNFLYPYKLTSGGKIQPGTPYHKCWLGSAKELGKVPSQFIGEYVTLEKQPRLLFETYEMEDDGTGRKKPKLDEDGNKVKHPVYSVSENGLPKYFCFVSDETGGSDSIKEYIKNLIAGLNQKAALRKLLVDQRAKQYPRYKDQLNAGTLADELGLAIVDGKFVKTSGETVENSPS